MTFDQNCLTSSSDIKTSTEAALAEQELFKMTVLLWEVHNELWSLWEWREKWIINKGEDFTFSEEVSKPRWITLKELNDGADHEGQQGSSCQA